MLILVGIEILLVYLCLQIVLVATTGSPVTSGTLHTETLVASAAIVLAMSMMGLYDPGQRTLGAGLYGFADVLRITLGVLLGLAVLALLNFHSVLPNLEPRLLFIGGAMALLALAAERYVLRRARGLEFFQRRIVVLGVGSRARTIASAQAGDASYRIIAFVATGETSESVPSEHVLQLQEQGSLLRLVRDLDADEIVVAIRDRRGHLPVKQLLECRLQGIAVTDIATFFEREQQQLDLDSLNTSWLVFGTGFRQHWPRNLIKRGLDVIASTLLLIISLPVILITAIAIRLESPGPILYWQTRVGRGNERFEMCKFRSMRQDAESDGLARWAVSNDNRITRVGRVIRKLRIDELPQVYNVLKGEMSFVGPRPERPVFVEQLSNQIPFFLARQSVRPGITGWAQVRHPYGASVEDAKRKLQYDLYYVKNHSFFLDVLILLETITVVLLGRGAR